MDRHTSSEASSILGRTVVRRRRVTVELAVFVVIICIGLTAPITVQYINRRVKHKYNMTSETRQINCLKDVSIINGTSIEEQVEQEVAAWSLALNAAGAFPMLISTTIFATTSDSIGRKIPLLVSCVGMIAECLSFICIAYFSLPLIYLVLSRLLWNCCGGFQLFFSVSEAYIGDIAVKKKRTMKFILLQTLVLFGGGIAPIAVGYWVRATGFIPPFCLAVVFYITVILYIIIFIPETVRPINNISCCFVFLKFFSSVNMLFVLNESNRRSRLLLLLVSYFLVFSTIAYYTPLIILKVLEEPFCWGSVLIGYFLAAHPILDGIASLFLGGFLLSRCMGDNGIIQVGLLSGIILMICTGLATTTLVLFVVVVIGSLGSIPIAVFMSSLSKTVGENEQGTLFAFVGALEGLGVFLAPLILGNIYKMTSQTYPPAVFFIMTGILVVAMVFVWISKLLDLNSRNSYQRVDTDTVTTSQVDVTNALVYEMTEQ
ncbi:solute carrier family 46 member 3-like [Anneissia japonica]|uniref:solute carrier family 46 member 3-like n=1 Tax=Anneissia japonica TaxID=1529436 RepID=UPI001425AFCF|nr:solute carrier family 46 member 3-like [Anneissia japonica]XP_033118010.1 solute carrier family 46 member 3-like [Anneissia japonica]XP_033118011.1 solute carrier family 46 member 3-like [Anneissia japonica]